MEPHSEVSQTAETLGTAAECAAAASRAMGTVVEGFAQRIQSATDAEKALSGTLKDVETDLEVTPPPPPPPPTPHAFSAKPLARHWHSLKHAFLSNTLSFVPPCFPSLLPALTPWCAHGTPGIGSAAQRCLRQRHRSAHPPPPAAPAGPPRIHGSHTEPSGQRRKGSGGAAAPSFPRGRVLCCALSGHRTVRCLRPSAAAPAPPWNGPPSLHWDLAQPFQGCHGGLQPVGELSRTERSSVTLERSVHVRVSRSRHAVSPQRLGLHTGPHTRPHARSAGNPIHPSIHPSFHPSSKHGKTCMQ